jgi:large subunit ribosomal protein L14
MKGLKASIPRPINAGARLECADNTGARVLEVQRR